MKTKTTRTKRKDCTVITPTAAAAKPNTPGTLKT